MPLRTSWDPTYGFVHYVDRTVAEQYHMINTTETTVSWGVDTSQILDPNANLGRLSLRLTTIRTWTHGLFILDLAHIPAAVCGTWPSFWSLGGTGVWPGSGELHVVLEHYLKIHLKLFLVEIDMIEFVNKGPNNLIALHSSPDCTIAGADQSGTLLTNDCSVRSYHVVHHFSH